MNDKDIELIIEISYNGKKFSIEDINQIELNELIKQSVNNFNIGSKIQKRIVFTYKDEDGDINIISNKDDIIKSSKKIGSSKYLSKLELNIVSEDKKNKNEEEIQETKISEEKEEIKKLEEINSIKDSKINELEEKIIKLQKECQKLKDITKSDSIIKNKNQEKGETDNLNLLSNDTDKNEIKNIISDMFKSERENLENNFNKLKIDLISEINNNLQKNTHNEDLNKIFDDISFIKENIEINLGENKLEQNNFNANYNQFMLNNMERMKPTKLYKCQNCKCCFMFNECFDIQNNKAFDEHNFKLEKEIENQNENLINKNEIINNDKKEEIEENNINEKEKDEKKDINNDVDTNTKKLEEDKEEKKEEKKENNEEEKDEKIENHNEEEEKEEKKEGEKENNEEEKDKEDIEEVFKFQNVLQNYFFNENQTLKRFFPNEEELDEIYTYYKSIYGKIDIQSYQESFIENLNNEISKMKDKFLLYKVTGKIGRIEKLRFLLEDFLEEKKNRNFNNKKRKYYKNYRKK